MRKPPPASTTDEKMVAISQAEFERFKSQEARIATLTQQVEWFMEQMRLSQKRRFGASSEKSEYDQVNLFNEAEATADERIAEPPLSEVVRQHTRKKAKRGVDKLPEDLPVEVVEHVLPEEEQSCSACGTALHVMGKEVREELKIIPAKAVIVRHVRYTYSCRECEKNATTVPVVKAPMPRPVIKGSFVSPQAIAHIVAQKFVMGIPLYRQEQEWKRGGIHLSRQTMSNWLMKVSKDWLEPVYNVLRQILLDRDILHADETTFQVLREDGKAAQSKSYMWQYRTGSDADMPIVLYEYQPDRRAKRPQEFLKDFKGYLHADGYEGYHNLSANIVVVGCWAHSRRKFDEALKAVPKGQQLGSGALHGKQICDKLFSIEQSLKELSPDERYTKRLELAKPVLDDFLDWLKRQNVGRSAFGSAVQYTLSQWKYLERYLLDGRLEISNNRAERSVRPFVVGRKNWLFANTPRGAQASAILYSIVETAKENNLDPYGYLTHIFTVAPNCDLSDPRSVETLLPSMAPASCRCFVEQTTLTDID